MTWSGTVRVGAAVLAQVLLVVFAVWAPLSARVAGEEVLLRVAPADPHDPFRGAYADLVYPDFPSTPIEGNVARSNEDLQAWQDASGSAYVPLVREGEIWVGEPVQRTRPAQGLYLLCDDSSGRVRCGIESWFLPQDEASSLEDAVRAGAVARVKVDGRGHGALMGVSKRG